MPEKQTFYQTSITTSTFWEECPDDNNDMDECAKTKYNWKLHIIWWNKILKELSSRVKSQSCEAGEIYWIGCKCLETWECENNYEEVTQTEMEIRKNYLLAFSDGNEIKSQGVTIEMMLKQLPMWKNLIMENNTVTDQMIIQFRLFDVLEDETMCEYEEIIPIKSQDLMNGTELGHYGVRIQYDNKRSHSYSSNEVQK